MATDALGRRLPGLEECGPPRSNRVVGIFYFLWLGQHGTGGPYDITEILAANPSDPPWGPPTAFHHWGRSELGYYLSDDEFVIRRHAELLVDAMVDVVIFDVTNGFTYSGVYRKLCEVYRRIRSEGSPTPQICFLLHSSAPTVAQTLHDEFYSKNLYSELWFRWGGKPLILASPEGMSAAVSGFFTFRESWAWSGSSWFADGRDKWPWLDHYPQDYGWHTPGVAEEVPVCVAQHPTSNIGRSFHDGAQPAPAGLRTPEGLCFAEQWREALRLDPRFIFVTGWNEWVAQRFIAEGGERFLGRRLVSGDSYFVDAYNQEYSRDIEPMEGGHGDNYYYQMVAAIRRFKGVRAQDPPGPPRTIAIDGAFDDWTPVGPEYRDTRGDTAARNHPGWGSAGTYVKSSGRNDLLRMKVARDSEKLYFFAEATGALTPRGGRGWMVLAIDIDGAKETGWLGYEFRIDGGPVGESSTTLEQWTLGSGWRKLGDIPFRTSGARLELSVPRADLGLAGVRDFEFEFKWTDNLARGEAIEEFFTDGDVAPNRRANYRYATRCDPAAPTSPDCNENAVGDACDIQRGSSFDRDQDGVPDECQEARFRRGDSNANGILDLSDGVFILNFLFLGQPATLPCRKSADSGGDGEIDISDAVLVLAFLFIGGPAPATPFPGCGADPAGPGGLGCEAYPDCDFR